MVAGAAAAGETAAMSTVCVTGAGGFIASWLVHRLLSTGRYVVHGAVRDPSDPKHAHLKALGGAGERLRLFAADMLDPAAVAAAVAGCDGVFHVASPVPTSKPADPEREVVAPAVAGTRNVLAACRDAGVRRVVFVSSVAAVAVNPKCPAGIDLDEEWWSDEDFCRTIKGWYFLSKTLAERAALAYAEETGLDVVSVCPSWVLGPLLQSTVNNSSLTLIDYLRGGGDTADDKVKNVVDVRDVADALVLAYEAPAAKGRYICRAYPMSMAEIVDTIRRFHPNHTYPTNFVKVQDERMFTSKKLQALGWKYRTAEETFKDIVESYKAAGILN
ncbi:unnamed protein product [Urochloa decumbens]|uniref:NAD-dependent epimerase/dehydratase domain-containing protein n=1 Tax=Urochloa decumbens TaxID=240449 RepID=A0ABC9EA16_9POAL